MLWNKNSEAEAVEKPNKRTIFLKFERKTKEERREDITSEEKIARQHAFLMFEPTKGLQKGSNIVFLF